MKTRDLTLMALFTALCAVGAFIKIPIPAMPITLQTLFTTLAGLLLGKKKGAMSVACYVCLGLFGLPVFTGGGGFSYVVQPTFGYLLGFCIGAYVTGKIAYTSPEPSFVRMLAANFAGLFVVYAVGMAYYWMIYTFYIGSGIGLKTIFIYCFLMVIPGDAALCVVAAVLGKRLIPVLKKSGFKAA